MGGVDDANGDSGAPAWFPRALVDRSCDPASFAEGLPSPWGRIRGWDYTAALDPAWWTSEGEGRWGSWPSAVTTVKVVGETRHAVVVDLDDQWTAHLYPFPTGKDVATLALYTPWLTSLRTAPVVLPVAGVQREEGDSVVVFPRHACTSSVDPSDLATAVGRVHAALVEQHTPNTERRWNERLKAMEDGLKSTTLWRAPHTKHVVGLPTVHLALDGLVSSDEGLRFVPQPRSLVDHLLAPAERLPGMATMAKLEQRLSLERAFAGSEEQQAFYETWGREVPSGWTSAASVSTVNGGVWIWRYEAMLLMLAEARAYGLSDQAKQCDRWLLDVSRIQARLGELRTVYAIRKGGIYVAIAAAIIGSGPLQITFVVGSLLCSGVAHGIYRRRLPPPY